MSNDKLIKIGKSTSDLIDIDCIDQSVEIDDTLVSFIDLSPFLTISFEDTSVHLFTCSSKNEPEQEPMMGS